ncbi:shikimate kinase [Zymomonas mobilis subsp. mobilis ZM4 = ATCC 31821]|uniref:Shikimate kinase n=2 Tax=Zymomonas mobilis subsp. mobilis TaxID=120045 RepID=AROK_ZYMMO|nr:shikimate kinase [Zymomonas mobilis]Q5NPY7.1 RecName: Full=Shikimate kinase; Short=SK [Zymomonas mobilis subsp. mobilis ZM4 = ATCC 31821]AAV89218.1 Shikimate kinase [Zymomonas mobilis subsp. mobilis ZM4 = ATCC 31821]ACV75210.1 Shikimate kinase [Zymomonas mobilis subsp. mobilis NCIMB 11163]AEH62951.1 Shikimate kinase [Zymomonas mobilis subsp. mobilis ATCC 10988]AFN56571.1 Shikimate kinase [Zymomonas mobilis subsp. mobilis ATCC 29191]AHB09997.1 shikimate kinase [Zymomonas mobilis subsp. mobi
MLQSPSSPYPRTITLIGMMGVGKSTIGRRLASQLNMPFSDSDLEIEEAAGQSITEIFARYGENYFRNGERRVISRLIAGEPKVLAVGGGAFMDEETRKLVLEKTLAIWVKADIDTLAERVTKQADRPLLIGHDVRTRLQELADIRDSFYAMAPLHVWTGAQPHEEIVDAIIMALPR